MNLTYAGWLAVMVTLLLANGWMAWDGWREYRRHFPKT